ncbi:probable pseudouridine-5'-phosphatase isoform X1 [Schistocerca americana]|uniref:probable pseudouridine-5'-phosphatase isoform X1 n=2 Tax=Schistocerca americana TaxID=7009 RepID=UPI001F4F87C8|nr:probable pseudouridine-5'-phosphatase isoform X1 [Schistocerca americana]XP_046991077.1 probable pseudouridine-5'-phosphatase isoform X1 [Schistocerca americana]
MGFQPVTHCIFDLDGLLLDTESTYLKLYTAIAAKYNKEYPWSVRMKLMGTLERDSAKIMIEDLGLPITVDEFLSQQHAGLQNVLPEVDLLPGAERLIRHLHKSKIPIAVATSSGEDSYNLKITRHKAVMSMFHHIVCGSSDTEVKKGKPAPDIYLICASRFAEKPKPEKCLVFEDSPNGVKAAHAAGMQVVMVPDERATDIEMKEATIVLRSLEDFKPEMFGITPF